MHIPDGYLSPATAITFYGISVPFLWKATREAKKHLDDKTIPLTALFSSLSFITMMFNIPLPGGTTGHAVGTVLAAIVLGPWMAMISATVALTIQSLFFGDGGILSLGANIFNMAIMMSFVGYGIFSILKKWTQNRKFTILFAAFAGYIGINIAAMLTGLELGLQPLLFHAKNGQSLYFPYGVMVAIPAMMIGHLTLAGLAEAFVTGLGVSWILKTNPILITKGTDSTKTQSLFLKLSFIVLAVLMFLTPLGLLAPGTAWGEWGRDELQKLGLGYIPSGFDTWSGLWKAPVAKYDVPQLKNPTVAYLLSSIIGVLLVLSVIYGIYWVIQKFSHAKNLSEKEET